MSIKKIIILSLSCVCLLLFLLMSCNLFEVNRAGYYQVKQSITGKMSVKTNPGPYWQGFGDIKTYKRVATVGFGDMKGEGSADIESIGVIFNDGSKATIDGLVRVELPQTREKILELKNEYSEGYEHFIRSGIVPVVQNAVKLSANLRSAQDAYTTLAIFQQAIEDQLRNGIYQTRTDVIEITRNTGDTEKMKVTVIVMDENNNPKRISNRFKELGCEVKECVIDVPKFDTKVEEMISKRKDEAMKTELAKQEAIRAKQDAITAEEKGKAEIEKARARELVNKIQAVTQAQKEFEVAELNKLKAKEDSEAQLIRKRAEADANRLLVNAGLTPQERAEYKMKTSIGIAEKMANIKFPKLMIFGSGNNGTMNPFDAVGLESFMKIADKLETEN